MAPPLHPRVLPASIPWLRRPGLPPEVGVESRAPEPDRRGRMRSLAPASPGAGRMISSTAGTLREVVFAWPPDLLREPDDEFRLLQKRTKAAFARLLATLGHCRVVVLSPARALAEAFLAAHHEGDHIVVDTPEGHGLWIQDPYVVVEGEQGGHLLEPRPQFPPGEGALAEALAQDLQRRRFEASVRFAGGNLLAGTRHWFVGADTISDLAAAGPKEPEAVRDAYRELGDEREVVVVRSALPVPTETTIDPPQGSKFTRAQVYRANLEGTQQPLRHIDTFMTVALDAKGQEVVLVGSPARAAEIMGPDLWPEIATLEAELQSVVDVIAAQVERDVRILRFPMPLLAMEIANSTVLRWRFATYANALLEATPASRTVWLPSFIDEHDNPEAWKDVEDELEKIYREELGYQQVVRLPDCTALAYEVGGPHCVTNYLART